MNFVIRNNYVLQLVGRGPRAFVGLEHGFTGDLRVRLKDVHARLHMLICAAVRIYADPNILQRKL